jgi:hypothetical protein
MELNACQVSTNILIQFIVDLERLGGEVSTDTTAGVAIPLCLDLPPFGAALPAYPWCLALSLRDSESRTASFSFAVDHTPLRRVQTDFREGFSSLHGIRWLSLISRVTTMTAPQPCVGVVSQCCTSSSSLSPSSKNAASGLISGEPRILLTGPKILSVFHAHAHDPRSS